MSQIRAQFDPAAALATARKARAVFDPNTALNVAKAAYTPPVGLPAEGASPLLMGYQGGYSPQAQLNEPPRSALGEGVAAAEHGIGQLAQMTGLAGPVQDPFQPSYAGEDAGFGRNAAQYAARLAGGVAPALAAGVATGGLAGPAAIMGAQGFATSRERGASVPAAAGAAAINAGLGMLPVAGALGRLSQAPGVRGAATDLAMGAVGNVGADVGTELLTRAGGGESLDLSWSRAGEQALIGGAIPGAARGGRMLGRPTRAGEPIPDTLPEAPQSPQNAVEAVGQELLAAYGRGRQQGFEANRADETVWPDYPQQPPSQVFDPRTGGVYGEVARGGEYRPQGFPVDGGPVRQMTLDDMPPGPTRTGTYFPPNERPGQYRPEGFPEDAPTVAEPETQRNATPPRAPTLDDMPPGRPRAGVYMPPERPWSYTPPPPRPVREMKYHELKAEAESLGVADGPKSRPAMEQRVEAARGTADVPSVEAAGRPPAHGEVAAEPKLNALERRGVAGDNAPVLQVPDLADVQDRGVEHGVSDLADEPRHTPTVPREPAAPESAARTPEIPNAVRQEEGRQAQALLNEPAAGAEPTPAPVADAPEYVRPLDLSGDMAMFRKHKIAAWKRVKQLRDQVRNNVNSGNARLELLKAESRHREFVQWERDARAQAEKTAQEQGKTTVRAPRPAPEAKAETVAPERMAEDKPVAEAPPPKISKVVQDYADKFGVAVRVEKHGVYGNEWDYVVEPVKKDWYPNVKQSRAPFDGDPISQIRGIAEGMGTGKWDGPKRFLRTGERTPAESTKPPQPAPVARSEKKGTVEFGQEYKTSSGGRSTKAVPVILTDESGKATRRIDLVKDGSDWRITEAGEDKIENVGRPGGPKVPIKRPTTNELGTVVGDLRRAKAVAERVIRGELDPKAPVKVEPGFEPDASIAQGWRGSSPTEDTSMITDGTVMVKADAMNPKMAERLRKAENATYRGAIPKNATDEIWTETIKNAKTEAKFLGYAPDLNADVAVFDLGGTPMTINGAKFKLIADATGADGFRAEKSKKPLLLTKKGEPVALIMPINLDEGRAPTLPSGGEPAPKPKTAKAKATRPSTPAEVLKNIKDDLTNKPAGIIAPGSGVSLFDPQFRESLGITIAGVTGRLQGKSVPKIVKADAAAGEAAVEHASAKLIAQAEAHRMARETLGPRWKDKAFDEKLGAVMTEANLRMTRDRFLAEGDTDSANNVATLVGGYFKDEAAFKAAVTDPDIKAAIGRDNNSLRTDYYQQAARYDSNLTVIPPADFYGVSVPHISLKRLEDGSPNAVSASTKGNVERPSPFRRRRTGAGDAYEISYKALVENSLGKNIPIATLKAFHDSLIESGNAVSTEWKTQPKTIKGEPTVAFKMSDGRFVPAEGRDDAGGNYLFVRRSLADEVAAVTKEDQRRLPPSGLERLSHRIAGVNLAVGLGDFTTHMVNIGKALMTAPGVGANGVEKVAGSIGGVPRLIGAMHSIFEQGQKYIRGDKATLDRAVELAKMGTSRGKYHKPSGGFVEAVAGKPVADAYRMVTGAPGRAIEAIDLYTRLSLDDAFSSLVKAGLENDTPARRREFINGNLGQYNSALQGRMVRWARQTGVGPFATAGTTFNRVGVRNALLSPGTPGKNLQANMKLRALKIANLGGTIATVALLNYLRNGNEETPPGVPVGSYWWRSDDGKVKYVDILDKATGVRRGLKAIGASGAVNAMAKGQPIEERRAAIEALNSWVHPFAGPAPQAATVAATGKGLNIDPATGNLRQVAPLASPTDPRSFAQTRENIAAAGRTVIGQLADPTSGDLQPMGKFFGLGPFTPVEALPDKVAKDLPRIHQWQDAAAYMDDIRGRAYRVERPQRYKFLQESINKLPPQMRRRAWQELRSTLAK